MPRPTSADITANDLPSRLYPFADDSMAGRRVGEPGNFKGTEYIAREFKRLGLNLAETTGPTSRPCRWWLVVDVVADPG